MYNVHFRGQLLQGLIQRGRGRIIWPRGLNIPAW